MISWDSRCKTTNPIKTIRKPAHDICIFFSFFLFQKTNIECRLSFRDMHMIITRQNSQLLRQLQLWMNVFMLKNNFPTWGTLLLGAQTQSYLVIKSRGTLLDDFHNISSYTSMSSISYSSIYKLVYQSLVACTSVMKPQRAIESGT